MPEVGVCSRLTLRGGTIALRSFHSNIMGGMGPWSHVGPDPDSTLMSNGTLGNVITPCICSSSVGRGTQSPLPLRWGCWKDTVIRHEAPGARSSSPSVTRLGVASGLGLRADSAKEAGVPGPPLPGIPLPLGSQPLCLCHSGREVVNKGTCVGVQALSGLPFSPFPTAPTPHPFTVNSPEASG